MNLIYSHLAKETTTLRFYTITQDCQAVSATEYESREKQNIPAWMIFPYVGFSSEGWRNNHFVI